MKVRPISESDRDLLRLWVLRAHGAGKDSSIFYERESLVVEDSELNPVMFTMLSDVKRIDVQFDPTRIDAFRTARSLMSLNSHFVNSNVKQVIFDSKAAPLIECMKRIGFRHEPDTFVKRFGG